MCRAVTGVLEAEAMGEICPTHIPGGNMVADAFTKYLTLPVWARFMEYILNRPEYHASMRRMYDASMRRKGLVAGSSKDAPDASGTKQRTTSGEDNANASDV